MPVLQYSADQGIRDVIKREHVDKNSCFKLQMFLSRPNVFCSSPPDFSIAPPITRIRVMILEKAYFWVELIGDLFKLLIVFPEHIDIRIVIPGDKSLVSDSTEERASSDPVRDIVFSADSVNFDEHIQLDQLKLSQIYRRQNYCFTHNRILHVISK